MKSRVTWTLAGIAMMFGCSTNAPVGAKQQAVSGMQHVLLLSIDGMHQFDLDNYVAGHPASALAALVGSGTHYTNVTSSRPSDSFPGTLAFTTGGSPATWNFTDFSITDS